MLPPKSFVVEVLPIHKKMLLLSCYVVAGFNLVWIKPTHLDIFDSRNYSFDFDEIRKVEGVPIEPNVR